MRVTVQHASRTAGARRAAVVPAPLVHRDAASIVSAVRRTPAACACGGGCPRCSSSDAATGSGKPTEAGDQPMHTRVVVGAGGEPMESEADRVAQQVVAVNHGRVGTTPRFHGFTGQRNDQGIDAPAGIDDVLAGAGRPLEPPLRQDMEQRFGRDFSGVRIHTDAAAQRAASQVDANAFTSGSDIVFDAGRYAPDTQPGRRLLAHELTHVVQQSDAARHDGAPPAIQREKRSTRERPSRPDVTVELDHGMRGRYLVHFARPQSREEVLGHMFVDGVLPQGYKLDDKGVDLLGWTWKFTTAEGAIDIGTFQKMTPAFQRHFSNATVGLTGEESSAIRARNEAFMDSRPVYLGGQSVREAFMECRDNKVGEGDHSACWGRRAGYFYYVGWQTGYTGRVLEVRTSPKSPQIIKDWEWWLNEGYTLHDAARAEEELQNDILKMMIFGFASALASAPGAVRRPTVPPSPVRQAGQAVSKAAQAYGAWNTAAGNETTEFDAVVMGLAGILEAGAQLLPASRQLPLVQTPRRPPTVPRVPPSAPPVLGSQDQAHWKDTPRVGPNPAQRLQVRDRDVTDLSQFSKQKAAADKVRQAQQAAQAANDNQAIDAQARVAVGQNVTPAAPAGVPSASADRGGKVGAVTVGKVSSQATGRSDAPAKRPATSSPKRPPPRNLVPEPYPLPPRRSSNAQKLDFYRGNLARYPEEIQQMIEAVPTTGRVKTAQSRQLAAIAAQIRALHTQEANRRVVGRRADQPFVQTKQAAANEGERFNAALTGGKSLNLTGMTKSGELVEFDSVRLREHRLTETKMNLSPYTTSGDVMDQMRRQATFARDWGFSQVRWEVWDHDSFLTASDAHKQLSELNPELGSRIDVVNPSDAFR